MGVEASVIIAAIGAVAAVGGAVAQSRQAKKAARGQKEAGPPV